ncbi:hypothetical protein CTTA_5097 [Comamonas testosteroni]|uniref:Lipoprotein n=1 Tax=Comamonas testosteroni TaxID=285 RepID=A0A5A7MK97_COMTE|nr:hypothetical protein [Comamonas testosteroni]GEQ78092.1 hypothetical protein CTTA_5097 [Comamonas testosteroni]
MQHIALVGLRSAVAIATILFASTSWAGCSFNWSTYGDTLIKDQISNKIGRHIPDNFCPYAKNYKIVLTIDAFTLGKGCGGYASASLVKKNSSKMPINRISYLTHNVNCSGTSDASLLTVESALSVVDRLMSDLDNQVKSANELN